LSRLILQDDIKADSKCLRFFYTMNGFHTGTLRVYKIISDVRREFVWMMSGDQLPGWKSAVIEINMTSVTEVTMQSYTFNSTSIKRRIDVNGSFCCVNNQSIS
jgi:hypothetical protein